MLKTTKGTSTWTQKWKYILVLTLIFVANAIIYWLTSFPIKVLKIPLLQPAHWPTASPQVCGFPVKSGPLIGVSGTKSFVVTPYVEHRDTVKKIRAISIIYRPEPRDYHCLLCCGGRNFSVTATCKVHTDDFGFDFCTGDIFCPVVSGCDTPEHVAIFSSAMSGVRGWEPTFIPVLNQEPKSSGFEFSFTVCISTMYGNYSNLLQVVESMEMYRLLGVQRVVVYKNSCSPEVQRVLDYYVNKGLVEIVPWPVSSFISVSSGWQKSISSGDLHYYGQIPALNDCVYRYMYRTEYIALHDIDELILPLRAENWNQLLKQLEQEHPPGMGFEFENQVFPISVSDEGRRYRPKEWGNIQGVNILEHVYREPNIVGQFNNFKVIVNPRSVFEATVHGFLDSVYGSIRVSPQEAHMYHIRKAQRPYLEQRELIKDDRIRHYSSKLLPAVSEVLKNVLKKAQ